MTDEILSNAETFMRNMRSSVIEIEQVADGLDLVLESIETLGTKDRNVKRAVSLLDVLIRSLEECHDVSEDTITRFEQSLIKTKQKNKLTSSANEVSTEKAQK